MKLLNKKKGDMLVMKKVLLSVPTKYPSNHTVIYEYMASNPISLIEYQIGSMCKSVSKSLLAQQAAQQKTVLINLIAFII